jgi:hypothetical protein
MGLFFSQNRAQVAAGHIERLPHNFKMRLFGVDCPAAE